MITNIRSNRKYKPKLALFIGVLLFWGCNDAHKGACGRSFKPKIYQKALVGFYPYWKNQTLPIRDIQWHQLTRLIYAFAAPTSDGGLDASYLAESHELVEMAHRKRVEVFFSIGGGGEKSKHFLTVATDANKRKRFIEEVVAFALEHCFDGVDIDWEEWNVSATKAPLRLEQKALVVLLHDLNAALKAHNKLLSVDVYGSYWGGRFFLDEVQDHVDAIHIMAYDYSGKWSKPMPHSSLEQVKGNATDKFPTGLHYWLNVRKWSPQKLHLGIPFYGRDFNDENVRGVPYRDIIKDHPIAIERDSVNQIYFNSAKTIQKKSVLVTEKELAGVMVWEITQDAQGRFSLLSIICKALGN